MKISYLAIIDITAEAAQTRHVFEICENWCRLGHQVILFVPHVAGNPSQRLSTKIVKVRTFGLRRGFLLNLFYNSFCILYLLKQLYSNGMDVVYTRQSSLEFIPMWCLKIHRVKYISEINGLDSEQKRLYGIATWKIRISEWFNAICYILADAIVVVTEEIKNYIVSTYPGISKKVHVVTNGANIEVSKPISKEVACSELGLSPDLTYMIFVGSLKKWHGVENAILALERLIEEGRKLELIIVGDGPEKGHLESVVKMKKLDGYTLFAGRVKHDMVPFYIGASYLCLAPFDRSRNDVTGLAPLKIFEYMACGKPIVTTRVGGLERMIARHNCGVAIEPERIDCLVEAVRGLISQPKLAEHMGRNGREAAEKYYAWPAISRKVLEIIQSAMSAGRM
jgi:glycosyltransferase involved in cell wall biosynthesis